MDVSISDLLESFDEKKIDKKNQTNNKKIN